MTVESPCVRNCCLDKQDVCLGCGRTIKEIVRWGDAADVEKLSILKKSRIRTKQREVENK
jgi:predicted Fe-S protein YdhL (DUF1289 family)